MTLPHHAPRLIGFAGWLLLIPLAVTSTAGWQRQLGKRWRTLHRLVYAAAILSASPKCGERVGSPDPEKQRSTGRSPASIAD